MGRSRLGQMKERFKNPESGFPFFSSRTLSPELILLGMFALLFITGAEFQIGYAIVALILIFVMHLLIVFQIPAKMLFHYGPVQVDILLVPVPTFFSVRMRWRRSAVHIALAATLDNIVFINREQFLLCHKDRGILIDN